MEFSMIVPFLLLLIMGIVEFGVLINNHVAVANAAREGVRAAALGKTPSSVSSSVIGSSGMVLLTSSNVTVEKSSDNGATWTVLGTPTNYTTGTASSYNDASSGDLVRVTVNVQHNQLTNFIPGLNNHMIKKVVVMRREAT